MSQTAQAIIEWSPTGCRGTRLGAPEHIEQGPIAEVVSRLGNPSRIVLALGHRQTFVKSVALPSVSPAEAMSLLRFRLGELFPVGEGELCYSVAYGDKKTADGVKATVVAAKASTMRQALAEAKAVGCKVVRTTASPLGAIRFCEGEGTCLVAQFALDGVALDLVEGGAIVHSRVAPAVGAGVIQTEIDRTLKAAKAEGATIVTVGGLELAGHKSFADGGLAALATFMPHVDLRLPEQVARDNQGKVLAARRLAFLSLGAMVCIGALVTMDREDAARKVAKAKSGMERQVKSQKDLAGTLSSRLAVFSKVEEFASDGLRPRHYLSDIVTLAANSTPEGLWLTGLSVERGRDVSIRGTAKSEAAVSEFVGELAASDRLSDVRLVFSNKGDIDDFPVVLFSVTAHAVGNLPLTKVEAQKGAKK